MKKIFIILVILVMISTNGFAQDEAVEVDTPMEQAISQDSLFIIINASFEKVKPMLTNSCYDCHSDQTEQPWYFNIPVINGWLEGHIEHARRNLDFSTGFPFAGSPDLIHLLEEIKEEVAEGEMPIFSYRIMHWGKLIEDEKQDTLFAWIDETIGLLKAHGFKAQEQQEKDEH